MTPRPTTSSLRKSEPARGRGSRSGRLSVYRRGALGTHPAMTSGESSTPYDSDGRVEIPGAPGWKYLPIETDAEGAAPSR